MILYGKTTIIHQRIVRWAAGTREAIREMPGPVKWAFGRALFQAQAGRKGPISKALRGQLRGVSELRADHSGDTFRLYLTLKCPGEVHVLFCHKKKAKHGTGIPKHERELIRRRYGDSLQDCGRRGREDR